MQKNYCLNNIHDVIHFSFCTVIRYYEISPCSPLFQIFYLYSLLWRRNRLSSYLGFNPFFSRKVGFLTLEVYVLMIVTHISLSSFKFTAHFLMHIEKLEHINICLENVRFFHSWLEKLITFVTVKPSVRYSFIPSSTQL